MIKTAADRFTSSYFARAARSQRGGPGSTWNVSPPPRRVRPDASQYARTPNPRRGVWRKGPPNRRRSSQTRCGPTSESGPSGSGTGWTYIQCGCQATQASRVTRRPTDGRTGGRAAAGPGADQLQRGGSSPLTPEPRVGCEQLTLETLPDRRSDPRQTGGQDGPQQQGERGDSPPEEGPLHHAEGVSAPGRAGRHNRGGGGGLHSQDSTYGAGQQGNI